MQRLFTFLLLLLIIILVCCEENEEPAPLRIVYASDIDNSGVYQICTIDADGKNKLQLTYFEETCEYPAWSPDGQKIAFFSKAGNSYKDLFIIDRDGSNLMQLSPDTCTNFVGSHDPSWGPNGEYIYYKLCHDIYESSINGKYRIIENSHGAIDPYINHDGSFLVYCKSVGGDICIIDINGNNFRNLTNGSVIGWWPEWSSNNLIVFVNTHGSGGQTIIDTSGTIIKKFSFRATSREWSPDAQSLLYCFEDSVYIYNILDYSDQNLHQKNKDLPRIHKGLKWSSDGEYFLGIARDSVGNRQIIVANASGSSFTQVTFDNENIHASFEP